MAIKFYSESNPKSSIEVDNPEILEMSQYFKDNAHLPAIPLKEASDYVLDIFNEWALTFDDSERWHDALKCYDCEALLRFSIANQIPKLEQQIKDVLQY